MSNITNAVVDQVSTKPVSTKFGQKTTYSFKVGSDWFKTGFKKHGLNVGDVVSFDYTDGAYGKEVVEGTLVKTGAGAATPQVNTTAPMLPRSAAGGGGKGVFPIPPLDGQRSIVRQNALTNARELYTKLPIDSSHTYKTHAELIIRLAQEFEAYTAGDRDLENAKKAMTHADD